MLYWTHLRQPHIQHISGVRLDARHVFGVKWNLRFAVLISPRPFVVSVTLHKYRPCIFVVLNSLRKYYQCTLPIREVESTPGWDVVNKRRLDRLGRSECGSKKSFGTIFDLGLSKDWVHFIT